MPANYPADAAPAELTVAKWVGLLVAFALVNFAIGFVFGSRSEGMRNLW